MGQGKAGGGSAERAGGTPGALGKGWTVSLRRRLPGGPPASIPGASLARPLLGPLTRAAGSAGKGGGYGPAYLPAAWRPPARLRPEPERRTWEAQGCSMSEARRALPVFKRSRRESPPGQCLRGGGRGRRIPKGAAACALKGKGFPLFLIFLFLFLATHWRPFSFPPVFPLDSLAALALWI